MVLCAVKKINRNIIMNHSPTFFWPLPKCYLLSEASLNQGILLFILLFSHSHLRMFIDFRKRKREREREREREGEIDVRQKH